MVVGFGFVVVFVCNTLQPWISHTKFISHFGKIPFAFHIFFFFVFSSCFFSRKKKKCILVDDQLLSGFVCVGYKIFMWCGFYFYIKKKVSKSYQQNHVLYTIYKHVYKKKIIYQKKKNKHDKKKATNSLRTSLHSFSCRLFKTYVNILSRAFYYCLRSLSRSRNLTLKACSTAAAQKKRECFENKQKNEGNFFLYIKFCVIFKEYIWMFNVMRSWLLLDLSVDLWCCFFIGFFL